MGREEIDEIIPAVKEAIASGIDARGPFPADSIYNRAIGGEFDVILAMYHDQGHIPIKVFGLEKSVSVASRTAVYSDLSRPRHGLRHCREGNS